MRRLLIGLSLLLATTAFGHDRYGRHSDTSISFDDEGGAVDCSDLRVRFNGDRAEVVTEDVPVRGNRLRIRSDQHGGLRVIGATDGRWSVQACKAVAPGTDARAIRVGFDGDELRAEGPEGDGGWVVYYIVRAPRGAVLDATAKNGPITLDHVDGTMTIRAINGPLAVKESSGTIDASTVNGPISLHGGSGTVKLSAQNGPLAVKLDGASWNGTLDAATQNGPLSVRLPRAYGSRVVVEASGHGPVSCRADGCADRRYRDDDEDDDTPRRIEVGSGPENVHLSTVNGPVTIRDRE